MANARISELTPILNTDLHVADIFPLVDVSDTSEAGSGTSKKITVAELDERYSAPVDAIDVRVTQAESDIADLESQLEAIGTTKVTGLIANNSSGVATGISIDASVKMAMITIQMVRKTDTSEEACVKTIYILFKSTGHVVVEGTEIGEEIGVTFALDGFNLEYTSDNKAGASYSGSFSARVVKL